MYIYIKNFSKKIFFLIIYIYYYIVLYLNINVFIVFQYKKNYSIIYNIFFTLLQNRRIDLTQFQYILFMFKVIFYYFYYFTIV